MATRATSTYIASRDEAGGPSKRRARKVAVWCKIGGLFVFGRVAIVAMIKIALERQAARNDANCVAD